VEFTPHSGAPSCKSCGLAGRRSNTASNAFKAFYPLYYYTLFLIYLTDTWYRIKEKHNFDNYRNQIKMKNKKLKVFITLFICLSAIACTGVKNKSGSSDSDYMTINEAIAALTVPEAAAKLAVNPGTSPELPAHYRPPYTSIEPIKLFDNLYFVGSTVVGSFIIDSGDGLVMLDTGCGDADAALMAADMKKLGLDPSRIKLIFISHEHFDHYGGVSYLKKHVCPNAKVAMSLTGWNLLQTVPSEWAYISSRPESVDIYLTDGMKIKLGNARIQIVATPGHSPGCLSFIFPVTDNGTPHMVGIMGGAGVWPTQVETDLYKSSVEYFKAFASRAKCDVGLYVHAQEADFAAIRIRKPGEPNPLVIGTEKFNTVYLQKYRDRYLQMLNSGEMMPYKTL
jgi:metallo-beta-lactamase class B